MVEITTVAHIFCYRNQRPKWRPK